MIAEIALVFLCILVYFEFLYPDVQYRWAAHSRGAKMPRVVHSIPFGIPFTWRMLNAVKRQCLMSVMIKKNMALGIRTFMQESTFKWIVFTRDPENLKAILATKFNDFGVLERSKALAPLFGSGIFTQDGSDWKHSRAMLRPQFSREQISRLDDVIRHLDRLISAIDAQQKSTGYVEMLSLFHMFTMDTSTEFLFGESVNSLDFAHSTEQVSDKGLGGADKGTRVVPNRGVLVCTSKKGKPIYSADFVESYTFLNQFGIKKLVLNSLSFILRLLEPKFPEHLDTARSFIDFYVAKALEHSEKETDENGKYIFSYELAKETKNPVVIRDQIFNILIAGRDTTASTLTFAFYYFALLPKTWQKVREEVMSLFVSSDEKITYGNLRKLKYVNMFLKEVLRLHPIVPVNTRIALKNTTLPVGGGKDEKSPVFIPKGMPINYSVYIMHRDPSIYGPDAHLFRPERWDTENKSVQNKAMYSWGYLPFNGGPRICLGQQFALTEMTLAVVKLAFEYRFIEKADGFPQELKQRNQLTLVIGGDAGLPIKFIR